MTQFVLRVKRTMPLVLWHRQLLVQNVVILAQTAAVHLVARFVCDSSPTITFRRQFVESAWASQPRELLQFLLATHRTALPMHDSRRYSNDRVTQ